MRVTAVGEGFHVDDESIFRTANHESKGGFSHRQNFPFSVARSQQKCLLMIFEVDRAIHLFSSFLGGGGGSL